MASNANPIDFNEIATSHNDLYNQRGSALRGMRVNDAKLTQIKLKVEPPVVWNPPQLRSNENENTSRRETSMSTSHEMNDTAKVKLDKGLCRGLNTKVLLPYPGDQDGSHVLDIDPCDPGWQEKTNTTPVRLTSESRGHSTASVDTVHVKQTYNGTFECRVYPHGHILKEGRQGQGGEPSFAQLRTQTVIAALKDQNHSSVKDFQEDESGFYFTMRGSCRLHLDAQLQHNWH